jgi:hypothetical protein
LPPTLPVPQLGAAAELLKEGVTTVEKFEKK